VGGGYGKRGGRGGCGPPRTGRGPLFVATNGASKSLPRGNEVHNLWRGGSELHVWKGCIIGWLTKTQSSSSGGGGVSEWQQLSSGGKQQQQQ